ncbi:MAG: sensor histidine kinase [Thermoguttaceae bacterium]
MRLSPEGAHWLVTLRFVAVVVVFLVATFAWTIGVLSQPLPLYLVGAVLLAYNLLFRLSEGDWAITRQGLERNLFLQILFDLAALTTLLYFSDLPRNPFVFYFVFHMIIAGTYLRGYLPYVISAVATLLVGTLLLLEWLELIPRFALHFHGEPATPPPINGLYALALFAAIGSTLWITVYCTIAIRRYVDRAHAELRQKEKLLGIGQLVAGIAHQIANPLDGAQNCLRKIGDAVRHDPQATEYVQMMMDALERIERTAKRVQSFALPKGITLEDTDVNAVVEATLPLLQSAEQRGVRINSDLGRVPLVQGDPYTLQEVLFNLCTNALAAMPGGGTLTLRTRWLANRYDDQMNSVALEVADTGEGIQRVHLEKIFEPFFTTRGDSGGTGLGLGLCRMLINEMGGRIEVRSTVKQGTVFTVLLNPVENLKPS